MRIAFLSWRDTTHPDGGGSEVYVESIAQALVARGHEVTIVCAAHGDAPRAQVNDGVQIVRRGSRLGVYPSALMWLARNRRRIDVIVDVINGLPFATPLVSNRVMRGPRVVGLVHHVHAEQWRIIYPGWPGALGWFVESRIVPWLYRTADFLTVSRSTADDLARLGIPGERIHIARNALPATVASTHPRAAEPRLCVLARLVPHKQIEDAFHVVRRLRDEFPGLHLDVIGDGWWREQLVAAAQDQGVSSQVTFHGHVDESTRDDLLARSWVQVMPSVKEGWCLAISEAGVQRTPTIAYGHAGGVTESIDDGVTGFLAHDRDDLVSRVRQVLLDPALRDRLGDSAHTKAAALTWSESAAAFESVLTDAQDH